MKLAANLLEEEPDVVDIEFDQFCHVQGIDSVAVALSYGAISSKDMSKEQTPSSDIKKFVAKIMSMNLMLVARQKIHGRDLHSAIRARCATACLPFTTQSVISELYREEPP